jgi:hypothetical protein
MLSLAQAQDGSWIVMSPPGSRLLTFDPENILIDLRWVLQKNYIIDNLPVIEDQLINHYNGHTLYFYGPDGNDALAPGLVAWIQMIQTGLNIPNNKICFLSVSPSLPQWSWMPIPLDAFENIKEIIKINDINRDTSSAKFVGVLAGSRFSVSRMRLIYELDCKFPGDSFITFLADKAKSIMHEWIAGYYQAELDWVSQRTFDNDMTTTDIINYKQGVSNYTKIWNQFHIEVITETDEYQTQWFTDKTAKCLSTGKPFLLLSGQHSLRNLKQMGFVTFDQWIDESYDECVLPGQRINAIINSLKKLYVDPAKSSIIAEMQKHANKNIAAYHDYVQKQIQLRTYTESNNRWQEILRHTGRQETS